MNDPNAGGAVSNRGAEFQLDPSDYSGEYGREYWMNDSMRRLTKAGVFRRLRAYGAAYGVVEFSGGNDEGGAESIVLYDEHQKEIKQLEEYYESPEWDPATKEWTNKPIPVERRFDGELVATMTDPVYERWGSFAGEFHVQGQVIWDARTETVKADYDEQVYMGDHHEEEW